MAEAKQSEMITSENRHLTYEGLVDLNNGRGSPKDEMVLSSMTQTWMAAEGS